MPPEMKSAVLAVALVVARMAAAFALPPALARLPKPQGGIIALQICLDRRDISVSAIDGQYGRKTATAVAAWCARAGKPLPPPGYEDRYWEAYFPRETNLLCEATVTQADVDALVRRMPTRPAAIAALSAMGFATLQEAFAERGHVTEATLRRLNPDLAWPNPSVGSRIVLPYFPQPEAGADASKAKPPQAASLKVSLSKFTVWALDGKGGVLALFPCSIAADKAKRPASGTLKVTTVIPNPNYTYSPDKPSAGRGKHVFPPGPNNPVGIAWIGLSLPGYGIHGTPKPESIGRAQSHGCFRLANWNAERLRRMVRSGMSVVVEQ